MKNRAKCKKCNDIIESEGNYISCKCGEIALDAGDKMRCFANDWDNLVRIDNEGNEIIPVIKNDMLKEKPDKQELIKVLEEMIKNIEELPSTAMLNPITHYDYVSGLLLMLQLFKSV